VQDNNKQKVKEKIHPKKKPKNQKTKTTQEKSSKASQSKSRLGRRATKQPKQPSKQEGREQQQNRTEQRKVTKSSSHRVTKSPGPPYPSIPLPHLSLYLSISLISLSLLTVISHLSLYTFYQQTRSLPTSLCPPLLQKRATYSHPYIHPQTSGHARDRCTCFGLAWLGSTRLDLSHIYRKKNLKIRRARISIHNLQQAPPPAAIQVIRTHSPRSSITSSESCLTIPSSTSYQQPLHHISSKETSIVIIS
jgi:hypothetical protein